MNEWVKEFTREVDAIDYFFVEKLKELAKQFIDIQNQFLSKKI